MPQTEQPASKDIHLTVVPLDELRTSYPSSELLSRPILNDAGDKVGWIEDLMMKDDHLAFAIISVGDFVGIPGRRVVVAMDDLSIVDKEFMIHGATKAVIAELTVYDRGHAAPEGVLLRTPRRHAREAGHIVATAGGEPIPGAIVDASNGRR
jgi:sporulation protein YlmC with PRC-barrel domain